MRLAFSYLPRLSRSAPPAFLLPRAPSLLTFPSPPSKHPVLQGFPPMPHPPRLGWCHHRVPAVACSHICSCASPWSSLEEGRGKIPLGRDLPNSSSQSQLSAQRILHERLSTKVDRWILGGKYLVWKIKTKLLNPSMTNTRIFT